MKTPSSVVTICLMLSFVSLVCSTRLDRSLKFVSFDFARVTAGVSCTALNGKCRSEASVKTRASSDIQDSIATALAVAIAEVEDEGDVDASAVAFAQATAVAYATIVSEHSYRISTNGDNTRACIRTRSSARAHAHAHSEAIAGAFAGSKNSVAESVADCFADAVATATVEIVQDEYFDVCRSHGSVDFEAFLEEFGYVEAVSAAFAIVLTAIKDNEPSAEAHCAAFSDTIRDVLSYSEISD